MVHGRPPPAVTGPIEPCSSLRSMFATDRLTQVRAMSKTTITTQLYDKSNIKKQHQLLRVFSLPFIGNKCNQKYSLT